MLNWENVETNVTVGRSRRGRRPSSGRVGYGYQKSSFWLVWLWLSCLAALRKYLRTMCFAPHFYFAPVVSHIQPLVSLLITCSFSLQLHSFRTLILYLSFLVGFSSSLDLFSFRQFLSRPSNLFSSLSHFMK